MSSANKLIVCHQVLTQGLKCPFVASNDDKGGVSAPTQTQIANLKEQLDQDKLSMIKNISEECQVINYLLPYILPTDQRLLLLEWLFEQIEPGIFESQDFISSDDQKTKNIQLAWMQYGIKQPSKGSLEDSIKGTDSISGAIDFLWEVVDFTRQLILFDNLQNPQLKISNNTKLLNFLSQNNHKVFSDNVRLFSPGFPKLDENDYEWQSKLSVVRDELKQHLNQFKEEYDQLEQEFDTKLSVNTTDAQFDQLESVLKQTRNQVVTFKQECESGLTTKLNKIQESSLSGVEPLVENVHSLREKTGKVSDDVSNILSTLNALKI